MPTKKPRITITLDSDVLATIDDYRFGTRAKNQTKAITALINVGLADYFGKTENVTTAMSGSAMAVARWYDALDKHGKDMVELVINGEKSRMEQEHAENQKRK